MGSAMAQADDGSTSPAVEKVESVLDHVALAGGEVDAWSSLAS